MEIAGGEFRQCLSFAIDGSTEMELWLVGEVGSIGFVFFCFEMREKNVLLLFF